MKKTALLILFLSYTFSFSQENYKYVIMPKKFSFFKEENKYNTNNLTKMFFEKEGFEVYYDTDQLPADLAANRCLALYVNAIESHTIFVTKISIDIKNCLNKTVFISENGTSKHKEYGKAYTEAFRIALTSLKGKIKFKVSTEIINEVEHSSTTNVTEIKKSDELMLFAIPNQNGYKIVDDVPNVVYELLATSMENVYSAKKGAISGTFLKKNGEWFFEYYENDQLVAEKVNVKF